MIVTVPRLVKPGENHQIWQRYQRLLCHIYRSRPNVTNFGTVTDDRYLLRGLRDTMGEMLRGGQVGEMDPSRPPGRGMRNSWVAGELRRPQPTFNLSVERHQIGMSYAECEKFMLEG